MRILCSVLFLVFFSSGPLHAWWLQNEYSFGSRDLRGGNVSVGVDVSTWLGTGFSASVYKDNRYPTEVLAARLPVSLAGRGWLISLRPFYYPKREKLATSAGGGVLQGFFPLARDDEGSYTNLFVSAGWVDQKMTLTMPSGTSARDSIREASAEIQLERTFYNEFYFMGSVSGFRRFENPGNASFLPVLDHTEMVYLGNVAPMTGFPSWSAGLQFARSLEPDSDSHVYVGAQRTAMRDGVPAFNSALAGIRMKIFGRNFFDFTYNWIKQRDLSPLNYYRLTLKWFL
ncbi:MAG: hypothetical protein ABIG11_09300 [bacterium]